MKSILLFLRGLLMGAADVIPGVSGGTIALITGIYPKLINSISDISFKPLYEGKFKEFFKTINLKFFIPLGLGIILAILSLSTIIQNLLTNHSSKLYSFFIGLILASIIYLYKQTKSFKFESFIFIVFGFLLAYIISNITILSINHSIPIIFISGIIAITAMILPGISGAFILLLLNQYEFLINAIHDKNIFVIGTFIIGALIGILSFSKLLKYILYKYKNITLSFLIGLMLGSLRVPLSKLSYTNSLEILIFTIFGFVGVLIIEKISHISKTS